MFGSHEATLLRHKQSLLRDEQSLLRNKQSLLRDKQSLVRDKQSLLRDEQSLLRNKQRLLCDEQSLLPDHVSRYVTKHELHKKQLALATLHFAFPPAPVAYSFGHSFQLSFHSAIPCYFFFSFKTLLMRRSVSARIQCPERPLSLAGFQ